jgi:hypothetical protein
MLRMGRPEDPDFSQDEALYQRYLKDHLIDGFFSPAGVRCPKQSVNRGKYSEPEDVVFSETALYAGWGVLHYLVRDLNPALGDNPAFSFFPKHDPLDDNYAHSEIWADRIPPTGGCVTPSKTAKMAFRAHLSQRVRIDVLAVK